MNIGNGHWPLKLCQCHVLIQINNGAHPPLVVVVLPSTTGCGVPVLVGAAKEAQAAHSAKAYAEGIAGAEGQLLRPRL